MTAISKLFDLVLHKGIKLGLQNMHQLDAALGFPSRAFPSIHIAGTNGKGSVATKVAHAYTLAGKKVGLFTSPHITTFRERVMIGGELISEAEAERLLQEIFDVAEREGAAPTFFEVNTLLAFLAFARSGVEVGVIEVGMGGRLDATNIVQPILSVITSVALDHTHYLGDTLEKIGEEKAGIIKEGVPVVLGPTAAFLKRDDAHVVEGTFENYEMENRAIAQAALEKVGMFHPDALAYVPSCRFQVFEKRIPIVFDVAHNPRGIERLLERVSATYSGKRVVVLAAFSEEKDREGMLAALSECEVVETTIEKPAEKFSEAYRRAEGGVLVICGTFYIMDALLKVVKELPDD